MAFSPYYRPFFFSPDMAIDQIPIFRVGIPLRLQCLWLRWLHPVTCGESRAQGLTLLYSIYGKYLYDIYIYMYLYKLPQISIINHKCVKSG